MSGNPVVISIPPCAQGAIDCCTNAAFHQRVTITGGGINVVFLGAGEGKPMQTVEGQYSFPICYDEQPRQLQVLYEYSVGGADGPYQLSKTSDTTVQKKDIFTIINSGSEDSTDNDFNDACLTMVLVVDDLDNQSAVPEKKSLSDG